MPTLRQLECASLAVLSFVVFAPDALSQKPSLAWLDGLAALEAGRLDEAVKYLTEAVELATEDGKLRIARGVALLLAEQPERAEVDLERALRLLPDDREARLWRAAADRMQARFFTEVFPQSTNDPFESAVGDVSAFWGQTFRKVEPGYEPSAEEQARRRAALREVGRWYAERQRSDPRLVSTIFAAGKARCDRGEWLAAERDIVAAHAAWPDDPVVLGYFAGCRLARGDVLQARALYTRVLTARTDSVAAYLGRALAAAKLGDAARAQADLAVAAELDAKAMAAQRPAVDAALVAARAVPDPALRAWLDAAARRVRFDEGYQDELRRREAALHRDPENPSRLADLAAFLYGNAEVRRERVEPRGQPRLHRWQTEAGQKQELVRAEQLCDRALARDPRCVKALATKAAVRMWNLQYGDAETLLRQAVEHQPEDAEVLELLSQVLEVAAAQKRMLAQNLRTPVVTSTQTTIEGEYEVTRRWWRYPTPEELARATQLEREAEACLVHALQHLQSVARRRAGTAEGFYWDGILHRRQGRLAEAKAAFTQALVKDPEHLQTRFQLAGVCTDLGLAAEALDARSDAIQRIETTAAPWLGPAWRELERRALQSARALLDQAERCDPVDSRVPAYRGVAALADGKHDEADSLLRQALALEETRARLHGTSLAREAQGPVATELLGLTVAVRRRLAALEMAAGRAERALDLHLATLALEGRLQRGQRTDELPAALLPDPERDPAVVPEAESVLAALAWARVGAGEALLALGKPAEARQVLEPVAAYGPSLVNGKGSDKLREPELWSRLWLVRACLALGDFAAAQQISTGLPSARHGVGASKGAFPKLERLAQDLKDEIARLDLERRQRGDERSAEESLPDEEQLRATVQRLTQESGLAAAAMQSHAHQNLTVPLSTVLRHAVTMIVTPKSNRWRENVRFALQQVSAEQARLQQRAGAGGDGRRPDPRSARDGPIYAELATVAGRAGELLQQLAVERGYPAADLTKDLTDKQGAPDAAPFTGGADDADADYAAVCKAAGLPFLRPTDRLGATPENMLSMAVRQAVHALDDRQTREWEQTVQRALAGIGQQRTQAQLAANDAARRIENLRARAGNEPRRAQQMAAQLHSLEQQAAQAQQALALVERALAALRQHAEAKGFAAEQFDAALVSGRR